jgi:DNA-binding IclR family transcriptional regulator
MSDGFAELEIDFYEEDGRPVAVEELTELAKRSKAAARRFLTTLAKVRENAQRAARYAYDPFGYAFAGLLIDRIDEEVMLFRCNDAKSSASYGETVALHFAQSGDDDAALVRARDTGMERLLLLDRHEPGGEG